MQCAFAVHGVNRAISGFQVRPKQAICAVRCASQKIIFAMRSIVIVIGTLAAEIHCNVGHDADIAVIAMPRCGETTTGSEQSWCQKTRGFEMSKAQPPYLK